MDIHRIQTIAGVALVIVGLMFILTLDVSEEPEVEHLQGFELQSPYTYTTGLDHVEMNSTFPFFTFPDNNTVAVFYLEEGAHQFWMERLNGTETMWDVVTIHIEDGDGFVPYHRPTRKRITQHLGIEYELMFTVHTDTSGNHSLEASLKDSTYDGEELAFMVTDDPQRNPYVFSLGLAIFSSGLVVLLFPLFMRRRAQRMVRTPSD